DVTPYAKALAKFLLGHPDCRDFGRKFKISFSGCQKSACGLAHMHDIGFIAQKKILNGKETRGFKVYVGGGLGAVPQQAMLFESFLPEKEIFSLTQAIARVFTRLGEKQNRARARLKFLVLKLGIEEFRRIVRAEQDALPMDDRRISYPESLSDSGDSHPGIGESLNGQLRPEGFETWIKANVLSQKQKGYAAVTVPLPLGDFTARQARSLAEMSRNYTDGSLRFTAEQNIVLRWVNKKNLIPLYTDLQEAGLGEIGPGTITDITACPGTDTCKLGIASSRGLARILRSRLLEKYGELDEAARNLRIKISGCFNSCGQHHIADIGFYGSSRTIGGYKVPHFQILLGGQWKNNAGNFGLAIGAVPSKRIPETVDRIAGFFVANRKQDESFQAFTRRIGKQGLRDLIEDLMKIPEYFVEPSFYSDWGDPREYSLSDLGIGECAGEVISTTQFDLSDAEREVFEAQLKLERGEWIEADRLAYKSMVTAAKALVKTEYYDVPDDAETIVREFKTRLFDTGLFSDRFAKGKFGLYLLNRHAEGPVRPTYEHVRQLIEKAQLFIEASHICYARLQEKEKVW
ncbi:MAG: nitrite/sulfite reductase, partial [FCB group bacterium]|nr:nitrite/sulfite reductase [FCB group bacterium]